MKLGIIGYGNIAKAMVAGLDGKFNTSILGLGNVLAIASSSWLKKSMPGPIGTCLISAPAMIKPKGWMG